MQLYLPIAEMSLNFFLLVGIGGAIGFISGLFGVGGGFLLTPLLIFVGIPAPVAVATSAVHLAASSVTGTLAYWRRNALDLKLGIVLTAGGLAGTLLGVSFFNQMRKLGHLDLVITLSYVTLLMSVGVLMFVESLGAVLDRHRGRGGRCGTDGGSALGQAFSAENALRALQADHQPHSSADSGRSDRLHRHGAGHRRWLSRRPHPDLSLSRADFRGGGHLAVTDSRHHGAATFFHAMMTQSVDIVLGLTLVAGGVVGAQLGSRTGQALKGEHFRLLLALLILIVGIRFAADIAVHPPELYSITLQELER